MSSTATYGLKAPITAVRTCVKLGCGCNCKTNTESIRAKVNRRLRPSHKLEKADYDTIYLYLEQHPISDRPVTNRDDEKKRDDGNFEQVVAEVFKVSPVPNNVPSVKLDIRTDKKGGHTSTLGVQTHYEKLT